MLASGMVFVIIAGEIDLSVGASALACSAASARSWTTPVIFRCQSSSSVVVLGILIGLFDGFWMPTCGCPRSSSHWRVCLPSVVSCSVSQGHYGSARPPSLKYIGQAYLPMLRQRPRRRQSSPCRLPVFNFESAAPHGLSHCAAAPWQDVGQTGESSAR